MRKMIILATLLILSGFGNAGEQESDNNPVSTDIDQFFAEQGSAISLPTVPTGLSFDSLDQETRELYLATLREHYLYRSSGYRHRREVFEWQLFSSKVTFYIVILLVLCGIYFSWVQFNIAMKQAKEGKSGEGEITEVSASAEGIKISSPVLGVIILTLSLLFFYLYLVHVYPIEEIF